MFYIDFGLPYKFFTIKQQTLLGRQMGRSLEQLSRDGIAALVEGFITKYDPKLTGCCVVNAFFDSKLRYVFRVFHPSFERVFDRQPVAEVSIDAMIEEAAPPVTAPHVAKGNPFFRE